MTSRSLFPWCSTCTKSSLGKANEYAWVTKKTDNRGNDSRRRRKKANRNAGKLTRCKLFETLHCISVIQGLKVGQAITRRHEPKRACN